MIDFNKEDIPVLDFIVSELVQGKSVSANDLVKASHIKIIDKEGYGTLTPEFDARKKFKVYLYILKSYGICKTNSDKTYGDYIIENSRTSHFQTNGGFLKKYDDLQKLKKTEKDNQELLELDLKLKRFESKVGKKIVVAGLLISFLSFLITVGTLQLWPTDKNIKTQKNTKKNLIWVNFKDAIENNKIDYLLKNSIDSIQCIDCVIGKNEKLHSSKFIFKNHIKKLYNKELLKNKDYSISINDSIIRVIYDFNNLIGNEVFNYIV